MIVADRKHQIALRLIQIRAHDRAGRCNVEAAVIDKTHTHALRRDPRHRRQLRDPARVDLHDAKVLRAVAIGMYDARGAAFDGLDRRQYGGGEMIECGGAGHAGEQRDAHGWSWSLLRRRAPGSGEPDGRNEFNLSGTAAALIS